MILSAVCKAVSVSPGLRKNMHTKALVFNNVAMSN